MFGQPIANGFVDSFIHSNAQLLGALLKGVSKRGKNFVTRGFVWGSCRSNVKLLISQSFHSLIPICGYDLSSLLEAHFPTLFGLLAHGEQVKGLPLAFQPQLFQMKNALWIKPYE